MSHPAQEHLHAALDEAVREDIEATVRWQAAVKVANDASVDVDTAWGQVTAARAKVEGILAQLRQQVRDEAEDHAALAAEGLLPERQAS